MDDVMNQILALEAEIEEAKKAIARRKMAMELAEDPKFKKLFMEEYFTTEAARLVQLSTDSALDAEKRAESLAMAQATGHTKRYLSMAIQMGAYYERSLPEMENQLVELRAQATRND